MAKFVVEKIWVTLNLLISQVIIKQRTSSFNLRSLIYEKAYAIFHAK